MISLDTFNNIPQAQNCFLFYMNIGILISTYPQIKRGGGVKYRPSRPEVDRVIRVQILKFLVEKLEDEILVTYLKGFCHSSPFSIKILAFKKRPVLHPPH